MSPRVRGLTRGFIPASRPGLSRKNLTRTPIEVGHCPAEQGRVARLLLVRTIFSRCDEGYKSGKLTAYQVQELLGLETRMEVDAFLKAHRVPLEITLEDLEEGRKSLDTLLGK